MRSYMSKLFIKGIMLVAIISLMCQACKKDYFQDSGKQNPVFPGSMMAYLQSKPLYFDTLVQVIHLAGMDNIFENDSITFFAPADPTIVSSITSLNRYLLNNGKDTVSRLDQISDSTWKEMLSLYMFPGNYHLKDFPQIDTLALLTYPGQDFVSFNGRPMNIGVIYNDAVKKDKNGKVIPGGSVKYAGYRQLLLSYIPYLAYHQLGNIRVPVASSDIIPTNGVVHVLQYPYHYFGFDTSQFILNAVDKGINTK